MKESEDYVVGIDLGGTKTAAALADGRGTVLATIRRPTAAESGPQKILGNVAAMTDELLRAQGLGRQQLKAAGLGIPCLVPKGSAVCRFSPNLFWKDVDIGAFWHSHFACPLIVDNDVRIGALAERRWGAGRGAADFLYVALGTGIGSCLILDGQIYRGSSGYAGEIGHMTLIPDGEPCNCGNRGCLEAYVAGPAIASRGRRAMAAERETLLWQLCHGDESQISAGLISQAADAGDRLAGEIFEETGFYLGIGLASVATLLNPERIIVGGGVAQAGEKLFGPLRQTLSRRTMPASGLDYGRRVLPAALGEQSGVLGAVAAALTALNAPL